MEIKIGIGFDNLVFGMHQEEIEKIIGKPDKISEEEIDNVIVCYFNDALIKTKFDKDEDCRMYSIEVYNPETLMFNQKVINKDKSEILDLLKSNGYSKIKQIDYKYFETVFYEEIWSTFAFEFNMLIHIEFSPLYKNDGKTVWPTVEDSLRNEVSMLRCEQNILIRNTLIKSDKPVEIKIGTGLDSLVFGMSQEEIISILGNPDKITEIKECGLIVYDFNDLLIKTMFDKNEDLKMESIEVFNPGVRMFNQKIINKNKSEIIALLKTNGYYEIEQEDYDLFETVYCTEILSEFKFIFNKLFSIDFSPLFDANDKVIWPTKISKS